MRSSQSTIAQMNRWIDEHREEIVRDIRAFCRIRSVSRPDLGVRRAPFGPEMREMLEFALMRAASYGFDTLNHDGYFGTVSMGNPKNTIGIFGHLDVVPEGGGWIYPPYEATRVGDFLIGRGVEDNKGACVMGLSLLRMFKELNIQLRHGLQLVMGCSEEVGMQDIQHFAETQPMPAVSLVPDMYFPVNYAQKGMLRAQVTIRKCDGNLLTFSGGEAGNMVPPDAEATLDIPYEKAVTAFKKKKRFKDFDFEQTLEGVLIRAKGVAAHAAMADLGVSAIHKLASALVETGVVEGTSLSAMQAVAQLSGDLFGTLAGIDAEDPETGKTMMIVGTAITREHRITLSVDSRLSIASDLVRVEEAFTNAVKKLGFVLDSLDIAKPFSVAKDDPRVLALTNLYRELTGDDAPPYTSGGGTYSRCLTNAITFGPGFAKQTARPEGLPAGHGGAHAPDEFLYLPESFEAMKIYAAAILELDAL